jgi:hypothetical protein
MITGGKPPAALFSHGLPRKKIAGIPEHSTNSRRSSIDPNKILARVFPDADLKARGSLGSADK